MSTGDFREEYARLGRLKEQEPELIEAALSVLNKWGTQGPLLLYVAEGLRQAYEAGQRGDPIGGKKGRARPPVSVKVTSPVPQVRQRPKR